jgi:hypothetical protein
MEAVLQDKWNLAHHMLSLKKPGRMPFWGKDLKSVEYRPDLYHLGEMEHVERGRVVQTTDGKRKMTWDGGVWAVDAQEKYHTYEDVLKLETASIEVEPVGQAMLGEMQRLFDGCAQVAFPVPLHYGTLVTRAVIEFGWEPFLEASALEPERLGKILDRFGEASLAVVKGWCSIPGVEFMIIHDDIAATRGPIMSPRWYRKYAFPWYARLFAEIHARGKKVLYISDGNYAPVLDDILATGPDGLYIESSSMDPGDFMLRGGSDRYYLLKTENRTADMGTPAQIEEEVRLLGDLHGQYPGMFIYRGGGNPPPENLAAFERAVQQYLVYS